ncbi:MAG TPA: sulfotransferase [Mycobacteriales bacterium]|nr:sulfotransferase [Mycobacteriales bacterium]
MGGEPNAIIIGAQKSATTSLHHYLGLHPDVFMSEIKELNYFCGPGWSWERGPEWYSAQFAEGRDHKVRGESSPMYAAAPMIPGVPERISAMVPAAKLIYVVRDPIDRIVSHYVHYRSRGYVHTGIDRLLRGEDAETSPYVMVSRYAFQLERFYEHVDRDQILVVSQEDLIAKRDATLDGVFAFLGVETGFRSPRFDEKLNVCRTHPVQAALNRVTGTRFDGPRFDALVRRLPVLGRLDCALARPLRRPEVTGLLRARLEGFLADDVARLRELTGQPFAGWSL